MTHKHVLTVIGQYEQVQKVCKFVCDGARTVGFGDQAIFHVELACDEACTNIIEHAYGQDQTGMIDISYKTDDEHFIITFHDNGRSFDISSIPIPSIFQNSTPADNVHETLKVGGLGIHFMRQLMDDVIFHSDPQQGNSLTLIKKLPGNREP